MSDLRASTSGEYFIDFGSFPREIRDAVYRECVVFEETIDIMNIYGSTVPLMNHDRKIHETFGVLDGKKGPKRFADEAREVFFAENRFLLPCHELPDFLAFHCTRSFGSTFNANLFVRSLTVTVHYEAGDREGFWCFGNEVPELSRLLECPNLQQLVLSICAPGGPSAESETMQKIVKIKDVCVELWKKLRGGMKTFIYEYVPTNEDVDDEDEDTSETESNGQSTDEDGEQNADENENGNVVCCFPGVDTLEDGVYYHFRAVDKSEIWQGRLDRWNKMGKSETISTDAS